MSFSRQHTFRDSILCTSISQKRNQLLKCSKVRCKEEEERIQINAKLKIEICPQVVPFRKYCHILAPCNHFPQQSFQSDRRCSTDNCCKLQAHRTLVAVTALGRLNDLCSFAFISSSPWEGTYTTGTHNYWTEQVVLCGCYAHICTSGLVESL